jgi:hypothetical protein
MLIRLGTGVAAVVSFLLVSFAEEQLCTCCCSCTLHHSRRLELSVDQSWPPTVLATLGQLTRLRSLAVLKLDCGRQQPAEEMWAGQFDKATWIWFSGLASAGNVGSVTEAMIEP